MQETYPTHAAACTCRPSIRHPITLLWAALAAKVADDACQGFFFPSLRAYGVHHSLLLDGKCRHCRGAALLLVLDEPSKLQQSSLRPPIPEPRVSRKSMFIFFCPFRLPIAIGHAWPPGLTARGVTF